MTSNPSKSGPPEISEDVLRQSLRIAEAVRRQVRSVFFGSPEPVDLMLIAMVARGHILLEGVPGVAKTTLVKSLAESMQAEFKRIQFTPDLLPGDITGAVVLDSRKSDFVIRRGPVFANIVLGDEINRAPAKTQSALLEAMQEMQVTIEGTTLPLPDPFLVLATQNPIEQEGVYPLPEAQLDRFLMKLNIGYPTLDEEVAMLVAHGSTPAQLPAILTLETIRELSRIAESVAVSQTIRRYIVELARQTRKDPNSEMGVSPRGSLSMMRASRARALLQGRDFVNVEDVRALAAPVFSHRIVVAQSAAIEGVTGLDVVKKALQTVGYDPA